jgi:hypothetical protein
VKRVTVSVTEVAGWDARGVLHLLVAELQRVVERYVRGLAVIDAAVFEVGRTRRC